MLSSVPSCPQANLTPWLWWGDTSWILVVTECSDPPKAPEALNNSVPSLDTLNSFVALTCVTFHCNVFLGGKIDSDVKNWDCETEVGDVWNSQTATMNNEFEETKLQSNPKTIRWKYHILSVFKRINEIIINGVKWLFQLIMGEWSVLSVSNYKDVNGKILMGTFYITECLINWFCSIFVFNVKRHFHPLTIFLIDIYNWTNFWESRKCEYFIWPDNEI